jgi:hypothetical protein
MRNIKLLSLSLLVLISKSFAQIEKNYTAEELIHENPGCPENSACTQSMGLKYKQFRNYLLKYHEQPYISKELEEYRKNYGLPINFLTSEKGHKLHDAALWNSPCKTHNGVVKTYLGTQFYTDTPFKEDIWLDQAVVYFKDKTVKFWLPHKDQASYIVNQKLVLIKEFEGTFYYLEVNPEGNWNVVPKTTETIMTLSETECPQDKDYKLNTNLYQSSFCKKVWDITTKTYVTVRYPWSC